MIRFGLVFSVAFLLGSFAFASLEQEENQVPLTGDINKPAALPASVARDVIVERFRSNDVPIGPLENVLNAFVTNNSQRILYFLVLQNLDTLTRMRDIIQSKLDARREGQVLSVTMNSSANPPYLEITLVFP